MKVLIWMDSKDASPQPEKMPVRIIEWSRSESILIEACMTMRVF